MAVKSTYEYSVEHVKIKNYLNQTIDITQMFEEINIYEDLFNTTMSGSIVITDAIGFLESFPVLGEETVNIRFSKIDDTVFDHTFRIYKVSDLKQIQLGTQSYTLHFVSEEQITNEVTRISQAYSKMKVSEIVKSIFTNHLKSDKDLTIEETRGLRKIVVPQLKPFKTINWLTGQAVSNHRIATDFIFYEDRDGFNFLTLDALKANPVVATYNFSHQNYLTFSQTDQKEKDFEFNVISQLYGKNSTDTLSRLSGGAYKNRVITHDSIRKKWRRQDYDYQDDFNRRKVATLGVHPLNTLNFDSTFDEKVILVSTTLHQDQQAHLSADTQLYSNNMEHIVSRRTSLLQQIFNGKKYIVSIPGDNMRRVGDIVNVDLPSFNPTRSESLDKFYSGDYIIISLRHNITKEKYRIDMEIAKDSLQAEI